MRSFSIARRTRWQGVHRRAMFSSTAGADHMAHFRQLQASLDAMEGVSGVPGGDHAVYHAVAEAQIGEALHRLKTGHFGATDEFKVPELYSHLQNPATQAAWAPIVSLNPLGMDSARPSISATPANMEIPEIMARLRRDGRIVNPDGSIKCIKVAVDPVWHLPRLAEAVGVSEALLREKLAQWTQNESVLDSNNKVFLPSIGGTTLYLFGDPSAITDPDREVACRPHDECNGSDVFGTDICTCRPYLVYAIQDAVETAQRGGCGIIAYYRKEGRALGEVTKFRVYNSRKYQVGGDRPDTYFEQTANIAGIEDARVQELMPDALRFIGVTKVDRLLSMSKDKYDALVGADIEIVNRISLPESWVPANATVEISAKIAAGYNSFQPELKTDLGSADYLWSLDAVRERSRSLLDIGLRGGLPHFEIDMSRMSSAVDAVLGTVSKRVRRVFPPFVGSVGTFGLFDLTWHCLNLPKWIDVQYPSMKVPIHSRFRQFEHGGVDRIRDLEMSWTGEGIDAMEVVRRKIDLVVTSVLLDAGAGADWRYSDRSGSVHARSEGLAIASLDMFRNGTFSIDGKHTVDAAALLSMQMAALADGFQVDNSSNPMAGLGGRLAILHRLGVALQTNHEIFQRGDSFRPGNILDHVLRQTLENKGVLQDNRLSMRVLWKGVVEGLGEVFPDPSGKKIGDCWHHSSLGPSDTQESMVPFHKLCQWLTYSLIEPFSSFGIKFVDTYLLTGLAEYRNGGLFVDTGVIVPRDPGTLSIKHEVGSELVVEWRALTVGLCDKTAEHVWDRLGVTQQQMSLAQILEGGTWAAGRMVYEMRVLPTIDRDYTWMQANVCFAAMVCDAYAFPFATMKTLCRDLAYQKRPDGEPPIRIISSGDVF